jgi:hypothetical protein
LIEIEYDFYNWNFLNLEVKSCVLNRKDDICFKTYNIDLKASIMFYLANSHCTKINPDLKNEAFAAYLAQPLGVHPRGCFAQVLSAHAGAINISIFYSPNACR